MGPRGMSLRQGLVRLRAHLARVPEGAQALCIALNWPNRIALFLVRGVQILHLGLRSKGGPKGMSLRQGQVRLGTQVPYVWDGAEALCSALLWLYIIAFHLVRALQILHQGPRSKGGL